MRFASDDLNLAVNLTADINIAAIMKYGLSGILFSDIKLDVQLVDFTRSLLKVYYLGSSRLTKTGNYYKLATPSSTATIFADSIYVDASGLGFGLIKLSGLTGLVGGTTGGMYDVQGSTSSAALSAADGDESASKDEGGLDISGLSLTINLANDSVGIKLEESIIEFVFGMIEGDIAQYIPDIKSLNLELAFGDTGIQSISLDSELDGAGTGLQLSLGNVELALGGLISSSELSTLVAEVQEGYGGLAMSNTAGIMTMLQNILDTTGVNLSLNIDKLGNYIAHDGYNSVDYRTGETGNITLYSQSAYVKMDADGWLGDHHWSDYRLMLNLRAATRGNELNVWFGTNESWTQNNIYITNIGNLAGASDSILIDWITESLGIIDVAGLLGGGGSLIPALVGTDADTGTWTAPEGATAALVAADGETSEDASVGDATTSSVTQDLYSTGEKASTNQATFHKYAGNDITSALKGLIKSIDLNLFTDEGYSPYLSGFSGTSGDPTQYISIKVELDKVAFNELLIYLYAVILGITQGTDADGDGVVDKKDDGFYSGVDAGGPNGNDAWYFWYGDAGSNFDNYTMVRHITGTASRENRNYIISNLYRELEDIQNKGEAFYGSRQACVQAQINVLEPYVRSLPAAMVQWLLYHMLWSTIGSFSGVLGLVDTLFANLGWLLGDLMPTFADMTSDNTPNPSLNIYIDLNPIGSDYGVDKVLAAGIQSIELMINCEKNGTGKALKGITSSGGAATSSNGITGLYDAYVLSINPRNLTNGATNTTLEGQGLLNIAESVPQSEITTTAKSILVTDPGTRAATLKSNSDGTGDNKGSGYLNSTLLSAANGFPQKASVKIVSDHGTYSVRVGAMNLADETTTTNVIQQVDIVWDASSVDLVAATEATMDGNRYRLAGYVYGYALNAVVAAIPVYLTNDFAVKSVQAYVDYNGDGTREKTDIKLDVSSRNGSSLPDIVYVTFGNDENDENDTGYYFGTALKDANGETYQALREKDGGALTVNGVSYEAVSTTDAEGVTTITPTTYPAYATYLVTSSATDGSAIQVGDTYYKTVTYEGVTYLVIRNGITSGFPVGEFSWNDEDVSFGWEGGEVEVEFSYSWGYATETSYEVTVNVAENNVTGISALANGAFTLNDKGNAVTVDLDKLLEGVDVADYKQTILNAFSALNALTVKLGENSSAKLYAAWDLTALESAIDALAVKVDGVITKYDFYKGLRADVTLWLGGKPVEDGKVFYNNGGLFKGSGAVYAENTVDYVDKGCIAQAFTVTVIVDSNVVDEVVSGLTFSPYADYAAVIEASDFAGREADSEVEIRFADGSNRVFTVSDSQSGGSNIRISYLCVISGDKEYVVWDGTGTKPESNVALADLMNEISYKGYTGKYGDIYLVGTIGTGIVGVQTVYLPVTVSSLNPVYASHGYVTTSNALATEIGVDTYYGIDVNGNFVYSEDGGKTYNLANGQHSFGWNFSAGNGVTEKFRLYLFWSNAKFYTGSSFSSTNEVAVGALTEKNYYYAIVPFAVKDSAGNILGLGNTANAEYQTIKVQLYFAGRVSYPAEGSSLSVTGPFPSSGYVFDKNNIPNTTLYDYIVDSLGTQQLKFVSSQDVNVTVSIDSVNFGDFAGRMKTNLKSVASEGGYSKNVTYSFTATADGKQYKFSGSLKISVPSTKPVEPVVNPVLTDISDIRLATLVVDPFAYASFDAFAAAFKEAYAGKTFTANNGGTVVKGTFNSLSFSKVGYADDNSAQLPLAGGTYDDVRVDFTTADGTKYYAFVTVIITNREVSDYEFVLNGFTNTVTRTGYGAVETKTWFNASTGAVVSITTNSAGLPTEINILNPFAFNWETIFGEGSGLRVTLADTGEEVLLKVDNPFVDGIGDFSLTTGYTNEALTLSLSNGDVDVAFNITVKFAVSAAKLTMYNTNLASEALAYNALRNNASVYGYESKDGEVVPSVYDLLKGNADFVWYVDGMFVKASTVASYEAMGYSVLRDDNGHYYTYNYSRGAYTLPRPDEDSGSGKYVFVYSAAVDMTAVWDHTNLSYSFAGGVRDTYAVVTAADTTAGNLSATVTVPVNIYSSELSKVTFTDQSYDGFGDLVVKYEVSMAGDEKVKDYKQGSDTTKADYFVDMTNGIVYLGEDEGNNYFDYKEGKFYFDPLSGIDPYEQVTLTFPVVGEMTVYKWFPMTVSVETVGELTNSNLYVGWMLSDFAFNFEGGSYKAVINLKETSMNDGTNVIPEQRFTPSDDNVNVTKRVVTAVDDKSGDYSALSALTGFVKPSGQSGQTYIDPYNFDIAVFRKAVGDIGSLTFTLGGEEGEEGEEQEFSTTDEKYKLAWDFSEFSVNYLGGVVNLKALITLPDGSTQSYAFPFLVTQVLVDNIVAKKGGIVDLGQSLTLSFNTDATSGDLGKATSSYSIDPFVPKSQSLPKGWTVNFTAKNPVLYNASTGAVTKWDNVSSYSALTKDYIAVSMPKIDWTWKAVTDGITVGYATMQIENGQRLKINVVVNGTGTSAPAYTPKATTAGSLYTLETSFDVKDEDGNVIMTYSVVWVGKATVTGGGSTYNVTFASAGESYTIQRKGQRKVSYNLTAYIGAVIDANGNVLVYDGNVPAALTTVTSDTYSFTI